MRDLDETSITEAVLARLAATPDARTRQVSEALVRHLHAFLREIEPTQAEWEMGIDFLTRTGQISDGNRQEFILLSDVLGASMLVDAINHRLPATATATTVLGPFFVSGRRDCAPGENIAEGISGMPLEVSGTVRNTAGTVMPGASVDVWHADDAGFYDVQHRDDLALRGRFITDDAGRFHFRTIRPSSYPIPSDGPVVQMLQAQRRHPFRPEHIHFLIAAEGCETLVTHLFAEGDRYLDSDVVFGVKDSLIVRYVRDRVQPSLRLHHDFVLKSRSSGSS